MKNLLLKNKKGDTIQLDESLEISRGGEGRILAIPGNSKQIAKIYHPGILPLSEQQFTFLKRLSASMFAIPQDLLYNQHNKIVGFTMDFVGHDFVPLAVFFSKNYCNLNNITMDIKKSIAQKLIRSLQMAHQLGIVIGDLNQYNVLVSPKAEVRFIDTDSYETPARKHTGYLLEDIRDYLYGGAVTYESDYFAVSVLVFYLFTYTHPFKGIHQQYKKIADRMIRKLPLFADPATIKTPKCYEPLHDKGLQDQFRMLYVDGQRFLLSLRDVSQLVVPKVKPVSAVQHYTEADLHIMRLPVSEKVVDILFLQNWGVLTTHTHFWVYKAGSHASVSLFCKLSRQEYDQVWVGNKNIVAAKDGVLFHLKNERERVELTNYRLAAGAHVETFENILLVIDEQVMTYLYIDEILNHSIKNKRIEAFTPGFQHYAGLFQNTGGVYRIFYNTGTDIATVKIGKAPKAVYQQENCGVLQFIEKGAVKQVYFRINGLNIELSTIELEHFSAFAYKARGQQQGFIFEPADEKINIVRTEDFAVVSSMHCSLVSESSKLQYAGAGLMVLEDGVVYMLNKKK